MKSGAYILFAAFWMCCAGTRLAAQQNFLRTTYTLKHFTSENGLGSVQIRGIVQDKYGFIWTGSRESVSRFDGYNFEVYDFDPKNLLKSSYTGGVLSLHTDRKKNLWIKSELFSKYDPKIDSFIHYKPNLQLSVVTRICFENDNRIVWFGTFNSGLYSFDTESGETTHFINKNKDSLVNVLSNSIRGISDRDSFLLVATLKGLWKFDKQRKIFDRPNCNPKDTATLYHKNIWDIFDAPNENQTWIYPSGGLIQLDQNFTITKSFNLPPDFNSVMHTRDAKGVFWLGTKNGLFRYDPIDGSSGYMQEGAEIARLANYIFVDREQNLWLGTDSYGLYQFTPSKIQFNHFKFDTPGAFIAGSLYQVNGRDHLVLIRGDGQTNEMWTAKPMFSSAIDSVQFQKLDINPPLQGLIMNTFVGKNQLWVCSWQRGITGFEVNPQTGIIETSKQERFIPDEKNQNAIRPLTGAVHEDKMQNLWLASRGHGVSMLATDKTYGSDGSVVHYLHNKLDTTSIRHNYTWQFLQEDEKSLWVINWRGVDLFRDGRFEHVFDVEKPRSLLKLSEDTILIGTYNNGIYQAVKTRGRYIIDKSPILPTYRALSMTTDNADRLWLTDHLRNQLVCFDRQENIAIEFNANDNLPASIGSIFRTSKGMIVFASGAGFTVFDPLSLKINRAKTYPMLTQVKVNNEIPLIGESSKENFAIKSEISVLDEIVLDHQHNNFAIEFSAMEMTSPDKNLYRHKLEGFDKDWIETNWKNRTATYTNLNPGDYIFKVKASNHHGIWSDEETTLIVTVLPPPWKTWWAYTLYGLVFIALILSWRRYDIKRVKLKHRAEQLSELDNLKSRFFANISHEFRTPITLILGPLKKLYNKTSVKEDKEELGTMMRNSQRLHRLINQLLDLSKIEAGKMKLHTSAIDLVEFLREISSAYESLASEKKIKYLFYTEEQLVIAYIDNEKIEKVIHNLLSNAFKFTRTGEIILTLKVEKGNCLVTVKDTGIGIPSSQLDKVFDRFYQVDSSHTRGYEGSGLGMALAKELVELHTGKISVQSTEGKGTTFTVVLPLGKEHLNKDEISDFVYTREAEVLSDLVVPAGNGEVQNEPIASKDPAVVLIVEDNADMRNYIRKTLSDRYRILEAETGQTGLAAAVESVPDLIISDIMMPVMDGYKLCSLIKTNEVTCHIPVILLTAKADRESKLSGLETGADDYLSKPFDADELKLIVRNRIEERRKMREQFSREITLEPKQISINSLDEKFLTKVLAIIEEHIDDENFSIEELSREAGFSNMHFYRKIKGLSGQTPSQFLRTIRLKRAAELLAKDSDNVTQIAYSVGFTSISYFNKCFKEQFGVTPGQYKKQIIST